MTRSDGPWVRSRYLSWFRQRDVLYLYHDLYGYLLEMSPDMRGVVDAFEGATTIGDVAAPRSMSCGVFDDAVATLIGHACLVAPGVDERDALWSAYPLKSPWVCAHTDPTRRITVVVSPRVSAPLRWVELEGATAELWKALDGETTLQELADTILPEDRGRTLLQNICRWTHSSSQLVKMMTSSRSFHRSTGLPGYVLSTMPFEPAEVRAGEPPATPEIDVGPYYEGEIEDASEQFDERETTLSHLFRHSHPALGEKTYGTALFNALRSHEVLRSSTRRVVEVGGGKGDLAVAFLDASRAKEMALAYVIVDRSPRLQEAQRERLRQAGLQGDFVLGDGQELELADASVDLVISNEVIADFRAARMTVEGRPETIEPLDPDELLDLLEESDSRITGSVEALGLLERYRLEVSDAPDEFLLNVGAIRFLEQVWRVLKPGGCAYISEFGDRWRYPVESIHLDHAEVSIHFGHLLQVSRTLGFRAELHDVSDLLGFDEEAEMLVTTRTWYRSFRALLLRHGIELDKRAYTREMLETQCRGRIDLQRVEGVHWSKLRERTMGLNPRDFKALLLWKA